MWCQPGYLLQVGGTRPVFILGRAETTRNRFFFFAKLMLLGDVPVGQPEHVGHFWLPNTPRSSTMVLRDQLGLAG